MNTVDFTTVKPIEQVGDVAELVQRLTSIEHRFDRWHHINLWQQTLIPISQRVVQED